MCRRCTYNNKGKLGDLCSSVLFFFSFLDSAFRFVFRGFFFYFVHKYICSMWMFVCNRMNHSFIGNTVPFVYLVVDVYFCSVFASIRVHLNMIQIFSPHRHHRRHRHNHQMEPQLLKTFVCSPRKVDFDVTADVYFNISYILHSWLTKCVCIVCFFYTLRIFFFNDGIFALFYFFTCFSSSIIWYIHTHFAMHICLALKNIWTDTQL